MKRFYTPSPRTVALAIVLPLLFVSCDKQLEFEPGDVILAEDAIQTPDDLQRMLNSNYDVLANLLPRGRQPTVPLGALASLEAFGWHEAEEALGPDVELRAELRSLYPEDEGEVVRVFANTSASPVQDCGIAPPPAAESPSQYSANPERTAPAIVRPRNSSPTSVSAGPRSAALQSR